MAYDLVTVSAILCEIMRKELDKPLNKPADFTGPYASGDTPITVNVAAKLGAKTAVIGSVGPDPFGKCFKEQMVSSGVDVSMVKEIPGASTGCAFVCYYTGGSRDFLYHSRHAAAGMTRAEDLDMEKLQGTKWFHLTGYNMSVSKSLQETCYRIVEELPEGSRISFDPNIRPESLSVEEVRELCRPVIEKASILFPSKTEAAMFTGCATDEEGCRLWANQGKLVVLKNGSDGCILYQGSEKIAVPSFSVEEVDPTGAGDTFCGAFLTALIEGRSLEECGRFACAAGAMSVRKQGPMEGAPNREELEAFLKANA